MPLPKDWKRQDIGEHPGVTDGKQHVYFDGKRVRSYGCVDMPVEALQELLRVAKSPLLSS